MTDRLTIADVAGVKLANEDNFPPLYDVRAALDNAFTQGSQGWGVTREVGVYLVLASALHDALEVAETADENHRMLKGAQMETGRLKKKIEQLDSACVAKDVEITELRAEVDALTRSNAVLTEQLEDAYTDRTAKAAPGTVIESHGEVDSDE